MNDDDIKKISSQEEKAQGSNFEVSPGEEADTVHIPYEPPKSPSQNPPLEVTKLPEENGTIGPLGSLAKDSPPPEENTNKTTNRDFEMSSGEEATTANAPHEPPAPPREPEIHPPEDKTQPLPEPPERPDDAPENAPPEPEPPEEAESAP